MDAACETCHGLVRAHEQLAHRHQDLRDLPHVPARGRPERWTPRRRPPPRRRRTRTRSSSGGSFTASTAGRTCRPCTSRAARPPRRSRSGDGRSRVPLPFRAGSTQAPHRDELDRPALLGRRRALARARLRRRSRVAPTTASQRRLLAAGITFPRDYRSCDACHTDDAAQVAAIDTEISRRTCHGCHPDVWFGGAVAPATEATPPDAFHLAHPGGPQADDGRCNECHVGGGPNVIVPMKEAHVPPYRHARYSKPVVEIVSVTNLKPGLAPTIVFTVSDRNGPIRRPRTLAGDRPRTPDEPGAARADPPHHLARRAGGAGLPRRSGRRPCRSARAIGEPHATIADLRRTRAGSATPSRRRSRSRSGMDGTLARRHRGAPLEPAVATDRALLTRPRAASPGRTRARPSPRPQTTRSPGWTLRRATLASGVPSPRRKIVDLEKCNACHLRLTFHGGRRTASSGASPATRRTRPTGRAGRLIAKDLAGNVKLSAGRTTGSRSGASTSR